MSVKPPPTPYLSVVAPVHNGAGFIDESTRAILRSLERLGRPFELIVVCDGSTDGTADVARRVHDPRLKVLHYPDNAGKGHAIAYGLTQARGRLVGWIDSDLDLDPDGLVTAALRFEHDPVDVVIGSKRHPGSEVDYPPIRRFYSWLFQIAVRLLFRVKARDTQVGLKVMRREMADTVVPLLVIKRYAFDLEVLAVGAEFGFDRIDEVAVKLKYRFTGTGINRRILAGTLLDTLAIAYRIYLRHWYVRRFATLERQRMDERAAHTLPSEPDLDLVSPPAAREVTPLRPPAGQR